jgi:hypothetical protein
MVLQKRKTNAIEEKTTSTNKIHMNDDKKKKYLLKALPEYIYTCRKFRIKLSVTYWEPKKKYLQKKYHKCWKTFSIIHIM